MATNDDRFLVRVYGLGETLLPLVHSEERLGNKLFMRRLSIKSGDEVISTPVLSGNSFRGAWRDVGAIHLMETLGVKQLSKELFGVLFSGGLLSQEETAFGDKLYKLFPTLRLLGFSFGNTMYASRLGVDFAVPLTVETMGYARAIYPELSCPETSVEVSDITAMTMLTRKDDEGKAILFDVELEGEEKAAPTQMLFYVEYVVPNTHFVHGFRSIYPLSSLEFGALLKILELSSDRSYGGMGSKGFGRMNWEYTVEIISRPGEADPRPKELKLGEKVVLDDELAEHKRMYEDYVAGLADTLREDADFASIIQFG